MTAEISNSIGYINRTTNCTLHTSGSGTDPIYILLFLIFSYWGDRHQKTFSRFKSNRDKIWRNVLQVHMHRLTESCFQFDVTIFTMAAIMSLHTEKCCHLVSAPEASTSSQSILHSHLLCTIFCVFVRRSWQE